MPTFQAGGREWLLALDAPNVQAVRDECKVNLAVGGAAEFDVRAIVDDPVQLPGVLWVLCRKQADAAGLTKEQFISAVIGDIAEDAGLALVDAILAFTPSRSRRAALREAWASDQRAMAIAGEVTLARLPGFTATQELAIREKVNAIFDEQSTLLRSATDSPANSESTPAESPGES